MAQQCFQNEYFDSLLGACKPCHLRCSSTPPLPCHGYCDAMEGTNSILWTCLGLSLIASVTVFVLMFLLRKRRFEPQKDKTKSTGLAPQHQVKADPEHGGLEAETPPQRGRLEYTVEECTCDGCAPGGQRADPESLFPLPVMEEGATVPVSVKTSIAGGGLPGAEAPGARKVCFY
ncbi:tumor necrosis factor receptor superfamily member 17 [Sorex araneus]|uniref:tumor necrosis factor receptor superfamily member 17 n=1 Tax=Sorex araneus TaxID=42254 RepID=UPI00243349D3|nr:tumor necrosis factor receptor superfamily member 17 [Sorex araneus]